MDHIYATLKTLRCGLLLLLLSAGSLRKASGDVDPVIHPSSYTAYYGEPNVTFNCFAFNASNIIWIVNNVSAQDGEVEAQGISTTINHTVPESNLTITSTIANNNTHLECLAFSGIFSFRASETVFYVQGKLGECHDLQIISFGRKHQLLKWDPPSTLNITAVEPDISSYIVCSNISTDCTTINVMVTGGDSSDLRQYTFPNLRAYINFTVTAVNIVGHGEGTSVVYRPCEHLRAPEKFAAQNLSAVVTFDSENVSSLLIEMRSHRQCFDVYKVHLESVKQERRGSRQFDFEPEVIESGQIIPNVSSDGIVTLNVTTNSTLSTNKFYNATLITAMDMVESESIQFSTYDVQDAELHGGRENISIQCVFVPESQARGCHVEIRNSSIEVNITKSGDPQSHIAEQTVTGLTPGSYEVFIFDWERDGSLSSTPSYMGHVNVTALDHEVDTSTTSAPPTTTTVPPIQVIVPVSVIFTLIFVSAVVVAILLVPYCHRHKKKLNGAGSTPIVKSIIVSSDVYSIPSTANTSSGPSGKLEDHHLTTSAE